MSFEGMIQALRGQAQFCRGSNSPFTAAVCEAAADDVEAQGPITPLVAAWRDAEVMRALDDAAPLRLAGAFHHARLSGAAPGLEAVYPPAARDPARLATALAEAAETLRAPLTAFMASPPQTNEVMRSFALLSGFLRVAAETGLPLTCLEIGASAGLNLNWSRFRYEAAGWSWGDPSSPVRLVGEWRGSPPVMADVGEVEARGCDVAPVAVSDPDQALRLQAYVWADQPERMARLTAAMALARERGTRPERADAGAWLDLHLNPRAGRATVLYHSIMRQYLSPESAAAVDAALARAAECATADAPVAWLFLEPDWRTGSRQFEVRLTIWPGGEERLLAMSHPHGAWVEARA
jgi:hypothetical protein